jgi:hypothetical protein
MTDTPKPAEESPLPLTLHVRAHAKGTVTKPKENSGG